MIVPGWTFHVFEHYFGAQVIGFNVSTSVGLSVQPYFQDDLRKPDMVIIAHYFPLGMLPPISDNLQNRLQSLAQQEIGWAYSLILRHGILNCDYRTVERPNITLWSRRRALILNSSNPEAET
jgi:hypothetical protein